MIPDIRVTCILRASLLVEVHAKNYVIYNQGTISIDLFQKPKVKLKRVVWGTGKLKFWGTIITGIGTLMKFKQKWNNYEGSSSCVVDYFKETVFTRP